MDDIDDQHVNVLGTLQFTVLRGGGLWFQRHFQKIFQFIVAVSVIDGGNQEYLEKTLLYTMLTIGIKDNRNELKSIHCLIQMASVDGAYY